MKATPLAVLIATLVAGAVCAAPVPAPAQPDPKAASPLATSPLAMIEARVAATFAKVRLASVRIAWTTEDRQRSCNGTIVTSDGYVATCGLHEIPPGQAVVFYLADGRKTAGKVLGSSIGWDVGMMKIAEQGPWPHVEFGKSTDVKPGDLCLATGYPGLQASALLPQHDREPSLRVGCVAALATPRWLGTTCRLAWDERGGGLFDLEGRLIGIHAAQWRAWSIHSASELIQENWNDLAAGRPIEPLPLPVPAKPPAKPPKAAEPKPLPAAAEERIAAALKKVRPAVIWFRPGCSGVIVSPDGYIATCAHHEILPGEDIKVFLPDGRVVPGKVLGSNPVGDVGLLKITQQGRWPCVELGKSATMKAGESCILLGFPGGSRLRFGKPWGRATRFIDPPSEVGMPRSARLFTPGPLFPGDSGGGVFDLDGQLIGIHQGGTIEEDKEKKVDWHMRIELLRKDWDFLAAGKPKEVLPYVGLGEIGKSFRRAAATLPSCTVQVLGDQKRRALGTIVGSDGWVLTKASELYGKIACRMPDGRELPAVVHQLSRQYDLALLKLDAKNLPRTDWSARAEMPVGALVAALGPRDGPIAGVVSQAIHVVPREPGCLAIGILQDTPDGLVVDHDKIARQCGIPIRNGDIILHVEGRPTPDLKTLAALTEQLGVGVNALAAGDPIRVSVRRGDKTLELVFPFPSESLTKPEQSHRRTAFPRVFDIDAALSPDVCGGPLIDRSGQVIGITIACKTRGRVCVVPSAIARKVAAELEPASIR